MSLTIRDILTQHVLTVSPDLSLTEAAALMAEKRISCLVATEQNKPVGILTEADLLHASHRHVVANELSIASFLSQPVFSISTDQSIYEAFDFLMEHHVRHLVVVRTDGTLEGLLTFTDILKAADFDDYLRVKSVADVMSRNVVTVAPDVVLDQALAQMDALKISCVVVVEQDKAVGIFTERDAAALVASGADTSTLSMTDVMTSPLTTLEPDASLLDVSMLMREKGFRRMVIADDSGRLIGIVTQFDVIHGLEGKRIAALKQRYTETEAALSETQQLLAEKARMERHYRALVESAPVCIHEIDMDGNILSMNAAGLKMNCVDAESDVIGRPYLAGIAADERDAIATLLEEAKQGKCSEFEFHGANAMRGKVFSSSFIPMKSSDGRVEKIMGVSEDITVRKQAEAFEADQRKILEMIVRSEMSLSEVLEETVLTAQRQRPGMLGSVLLMDADGRHLRHGAAPNLPQTYSDAINGVEIGPNVGSCGTAAFIRERVIVSDIANDPRWADYKELALSHGLAACWSEPIVSQGKVLGTFAMYDPEPKAPDARDVAIIERITTLAENAISHKQAESELKAMNQHMDHLVRNTPAVIYSCEVEAPFAIHYISPNIYGQTGYTQQDFLEDDHFWASRIHPDDQERIFAGLPQLFEHHHHSHEYRFQFADGSWHWMYDELVLQHDDQGEPREIFGYWIDITERKQAEQAYREAAERNELILQSSMDGVIIADDKGDIVQVNPAYCEMVGYREEELATMNIVQMEAMLTPEQVGEKIGWMMQNGSVRFESQHRHKDGHAVDLDVSIFVMQPEGKKPLVSAFVRDITERKKAEEQLRLLENAVASVNESVIITDLEGRIVYVNPSFTKNTGYSLDEAIGNTPSMLNSKKQSKTFYKHFWGTIKSGKPWSGRILDRKKDGTIFPVYLSVAPIFDQGGIITHFVAVHEDLSETEAMQKKMMEAQKMEAVGTMAGGIAHDFNNMLAGLIGNLYLIQMHHQGDAEIEARVHTMEQAMMHASKMIAQMLTFARKDTPEIAPIDLRPFFKETSKLAEASLPENIQFRLRCTGDAPLMVNADATQLQQVVMNFITNAKHAVADIEHPEIELIIDRRAPSRRQLKTYMWEKQGENWCRISCRDNGCGIVRSDLDHIFDPFFTTRAPGEGTGLGLAMVFGAVQNHHGIIDVQSKLGEGTTFTLYLPCYEHEAVELEMPSTVTINGGGRTILLVDDEPELRRVLAEVLNGEGFHVLEASDGKEAVRIFDAEGDSIALIVLDVVMPNMGGVAAAVEIRQRNADVPILFQTGYGEQTQIQAASAINNAQSLQKPIMIPELFRAMNAAMKR